MQSRRNCLGNPGPRWRTGEAGRTAEVKLEAQIPQEGLFLGTSTSGDLSQADLDFSGLTADRDRELRLALDGESAITITVLAEPYTDLAALAFAIEAEVRSGAVAELTGAIRNIAVNKVNSFFSMRDGG